MDIDFDKEMENCGFEKLNIDCWVLFEWIWEEIWIVVLDYLGLLLVDRLIVRNFINFENRVFYFKRVIIGLLKSVSDVGVYEFKRKKFLEMVKL